MNNIFWFAAGLLTAIAIVLVAIPLLRASAATRPGGPWRSVAAVASAVAFIGLAVAIYRTTGRPDLTAPPAQPKSAPAAADDGVKHADSLDISVQRLEARLARDGGSNDDWELLAKSYEFMSQPENAARARQHVAAGPGSASTAANGISITGTVSIDSKLAAQVQPGDTLFIYAKATDSPGPPLAVLRLPAEHWPVQFKLDDSLAMMPARKLSGFSKVTVEARISRSGQAMRAPGDLYEVSQTLNPAGSKPVTLVISHVVS